MNVLSGNGRSILMRAGINTVMIITLVLVSNCNSGESSSLVEHHSINSEDLNFLEEVEVAASFADRFYEPVSSIVEPDMSTFGLPAEASEVFNLTRILRMAGIDNTPESLLETDSLFSMHSTVRIIR